MTFSKIVSFTLLVALCFAKENLYAQNDIVQSVYFKKNSYQIDKKYDGLLKDIAAKCGSGNFSHLKIFAFSDTTGTADHNEMLSKKRAGAVYDYLLSHAKFDTTKIYITWLGESAESYDLHFADAHIQQNCADILVSFKKK